MLLRFIWPILCAASFHFMTGEAVAATADQLCGAEAAPAPSGAALRGAAREIEQQLVRDQQGAPELASQMAALLQIPGTDADQTDKASLAAYCLAAGELMRVGQRGSQYQAQTYLLSAFRAAEAAGERQIAAKAAYRLGLVSQIAPSVSGTRGRGKLRSPGTGEAIEEAEQATAREEVDVCPSLSAPDLLSRSNAYVTTLSFECAAQTANKVGQAELEALAELKLARLGLQFLEKQPERAERIKAIAGESASRGLAAADRIEDPVLRAEMYGRLASAALDLGQLDALMRQAPRAMREAPQSDSAAHAFAAGLEARIALADGDRPKAAELARAAILLESRRSLPARLPEWYLLLGQAEPEQLRTHVLAAYRALDALRPLLPRVDPVTEEPSFSVYMRAVFESAADVQLSVTRDSPEAIRTAQEIVEAYRQAELQSVFGSECVPPRDPLKPEELRPGEILLYPILLPDRVELLYAVGGDGRYKRLPANRSTNRADVARLVERMVLSMSYGSDEDWREPARRLHEILIEPVEEHLGAESMLAIIPDGPLRALPFAALLGADDRFLIQRTRISIAPALAYSQPGELREDPPARIIAASLQKELELPEGYFSRLEGTAEEARIAAASAPRSQHIADFSKADLVRALSGNSVDVLHLATHASFNGRADRAFIVADGELIMLSELRALIAQNRTRGEELDLLILSACETAVGDDDASMGLAGAAVQAGAKSAIASLWQVNDAGTAELMRGFYERFRSGKSKSEAVRDAQLALIAGGGTNANPNIWAAFTLLGAWR